MIPLEVPLVVAFSFFTKTDTNDHILLIFYVIYITESPLVVFFENVTPTIIIPSRSTEHHVEFVPDGLFFAKKAHKNQFTPDPIHFQSISASPNPSTMISAVNLLSPPNRMPPNVEIYRHSSWRAFWWLCHRRILLAAQTSPSTRRLPLICLLRPCNASTPFKMYPLPSHRLRLLLRCRSVYSEPPAT